MAVAAIMGDTLCFCVFSLDRVPLRVSAPHLSPVWAGTEFGNDLSAAAREGALKQRLTATGHSSLKNGGVHLTWWWALGSAAHALLCDGGCSSHPGPGTGFYPRSDIEPRGDVGRQQGNRQLLACARRAAELEPPHQAQPPGDRRRSQPQVMAAPRGRAGLH